MADPGNVVGPNGKPAAANNGYPHLETAFMDVSRIVGHTGLFNAMAVNLIVMSLACGLTGQLGAARLLFSMGRDNVLPRRPFGYLGRTNVPSANVLIVATNLPPMRL